MNSLHRPSPTQPHYPSIVAAGVLFAFLWLSLVQHRAGVVDQLTAGVTSSIRHYFKHRQGIEAAQEHRSPLAYRI
jgi:hypothetical protein